MKDKIYGREEVKELSGHDFGKLSYLDIEITSGRVLERVVVDLWLKSL